MDAYYCFKKLAAAVQAVSNVFHHIRGFTSLFLCLISVNTALHKIWLMRNSLLYTALYSNTCTDLRCSPLEDNESD